MKNKEEQWYECWFDSPYYHMLYSDRDESEAENFIKHLCDHLPLEKNDPVWDMACGNGRHARALAQHSLLVTGTDLSPKNIEIAQRDKREGMEFLVHDMRSPFRNNYYSAVFNLFTSFGYFENKRDDKKVFETAHTALKDGGLFILDYFNATKVKKKPSETITLIRNNIEFHVNKVIGEENVRKTIKFEDMGRRFEFTENVALLELKEFEMIGESCGFELVEKFGNYLLQEFDALNSDRLIMIFKRL